MELISRRAAIDAVRGYLVGKRCPDGGTLTCRLIENEVINKLPTIQPDNNSEVPNSSDCISRQAAIDALDEQIETCDKSLSSFDISMKDAYAVKVERASLVSFREILEYLPPAQPKRGRWIPVDAFTAFGGDEATWMANGNPTAFHYCSVCKGQAYAGEDGESLLTDFCPNCGAKMEVTT